MEAASKDRHMCTPFEWQTKYWPAILSQVGHLMAWINRNNVRPTQAPPVNAHSPLINNPAGVSLSLGKHGLRPEDLHIPDSKSRKSAVGTSASPVSIADPASVPAVSQTPITMGTPTSHPMSTPAAASKRPSTGSPSGGQAPPSKVQIGTGGPIAAGDSAQDEAHTKRLAKEEEEEMKRQEERKNPLEYVKTRVFNSMGKEPSDQSTVTLPQPVVQGLADKVRNVGLSESMTTDANATTQTTAVQKAQLPSSSWSGNIAPRLLAEAFANTTDIEFALKSLYPARHELSMSDMLVNGDEDEQGVTEEVNDLGFLSPLAGDDAYSWLKISEIPWNGDIKNILETNNLGVVA